MEPMEGNSLMQLLNNRIFWVCVMAWFVAQAAKVVLTLAVERRLDFRRFFGLGGMPSSHSAVVTALAVGVGIRSGFNSTLFAIACVLAVITMTDAAGVRRAAGKQAAMINKIVQDMIQNGGDLPNETLKELLGHTPLQVLVGALLGAVIAVLMLGLYSARKRPSFREEKYASSRRTALARLPAALVRLCPSERGMERRSS